MANDTETLADVSALCRDIARIYRNAPSNKIEIEGLKVCDYLDELANRIDAAAKREIPQLDPDWKAICEKCKDGDIEPDCEYHGEPNGCNSPIYGEHPKAQPAGNAAAMREALERIQRLVTSDSPADEVEIANICRDALSVPARNCDRPECATSKAAQNVWRKEDCGKTPYHEWLLAPAEERKGENDGSK